ncbi:structural maintenance of chromosomes protein-like protein 5 [Decorospora gaudefroyi]|uniref:Structural maintenance of chromosomes protein 5 n=1 Tax=Decorospora gaudefroyi TaxID=184978 RepID=A0A6A5K542_9PLEO|nr:structural maintenance of chromosomes protein-like protein 5 [Decorospora gaudefroyi]
MPGIVQRGRKRPTPVVSEDEDEQSDAPSSASGSSKRARHAHDASDMPVRTNGDANGSAAYIEDEFQSGSLVRVKLTNFVTYTAAEFHLGPSLNMVIGPNGTGKSTLVCAICLGLGWGSEYLGRAKDLGAFVKHGATEAVIEIELAAGAGNGPNQIVQRNIRKEDNKSFFLLNGKRVPQNAVTTMARAYSIQIDNLCQFLPQDRVVEFAKMSDVDRLRETLRAAAPPHMVEWHDQLKLLRSEERSCETKQKDERAHLEKLEKQQNSTRDDVERFHEREGLLRKSKCLQKVKPIIEFELRKKEINQLKEDLQTARLDLGQIDVEMEPARRAQIEVESYQNQIQQVMELRKNRVEMIKTQAEKLAKKIDQDQQKASDCKSEVEEELNAKRQRELNIKRTKDVITKLKKQRQEGSVQYDPSSYDEPKQGLRKQITSIANDLLVKEDAKVDLRTRTQTLREELLKLRGDREQLNTQSGKQASLLQKISTDTAKAWAWIQENKNSLQLKGEVLGPAILECSIPEPRYAQAVENQLTRGDVVAITCTNSDDQKLLSDRLLKKSVNGGLELHDVHLRTSPKQLESYQPPVALSHLPQYGFEGYILDYIRGPKAILAMLCDNKRLHQQYAAVSNTPIRQYVNGRDTVKVVTRREYNASSTVFTKLRPAQWFIDQPGNAADTRKLEREIKELGDKLKELVETHKNVDNELKHKKDEVQADQDRMKKALAEWARLPDKIASKQSELNMYEEDKSTTNNRIRAIQTKERNLKLSAATLTLDYAKTVTQMRTFYESLVEAEIRFIEAKSELNALRNENKAIVQKQQRKKDEIKQLEQRKTVLRDACRQMGRDIQQDIAALPEEERQIVAEYKDLPSLAALDEEVQAVNARLGLMAEGNPGAIRAYEKREEDIARTREKLEQHIGSLQETKRQITEIREQWEPELDRLIRKISDAFAHNFKKIGCAGEVEVYKDEEDFDNWSIQISVRFRAAEPLSILNAHRQSGGERAVSTIFYLMALQDLAQSPFRVVDEINQGMDPRNERLVHGRMVDIACQERTSQYFLVTPKLLTGLKFHPKMKVHVINSGEHVPDSNLLERGWDFKEMAKVALRTRKGIHVP